MLPSAFEAAGASDATDPEEELLSTSPLRLLQVCPFLQGIFLLNACPFWQGVQQESRCPFNDARYTPQLHFLHTQLLCGDNLVPVESFTKSCICHIPLNMAPLQAVDLALARLERGADTGLLDPARLLPGESQPPDAEDALQSSLQHLRAAILDLWGRSGGI